MKKFNLSKNSIIITALVISFVFSFAGVSSVLAATNIPLGAADGFAVLAGSAITDTNISVISGDVGLSPAAGTFYLTPVLTPAEVAGTIYATDATGPGGAGGNNPILVGAAQVSLTAAYTDAANQIPFTTLPGGDNQLGSQLLTPGIYRFGGAATANLIGTLTLDGQGDPNAVFIFQASSTLTTAASSIVSLINGAQACNVFWQIGTSATLGTGTLFKGNLMVDQSITDNGGSIIEGRLLASIAAVTLNGTTVTKATCVVPPPPPAPVSSSGGSCGSSSSAPLINVTEIPSPLTLPLGPGPVTYIYTATNMGAFSMNNVSLMDNSCSSVTFVSGDDNNNAMLDTNEVWVYSCTRTVSETTTSTVTARGSANCWDAFDTASATVVVGVPALPNTGIVPPLIHLVKTPNVFLLLPGGGPVTYNYLVTNPGTEPLSNVSVIDDKCTGLPGRVFGHPGDLNHNDLLESNEVWQFTCQTYLTQTTTNVGTAEGSANGLTAIDFSPATVVVAAAVPGLPNTGAPNDKNTLWNMAIAAGILMLISIMALVVVVKKRTN